MKHFLRIVTVCWLLPSLLWACNITETGNPSATAQLIANSTNDEIVIGDVAGQVRVEEFWVAVRHLRFVPEGQCDTSPLPGTLVEGPLVVNLLDREMLALPVGDVRYCGIEVARTRADTVPNGAPAELMGSSILIRGRRGDDTPFLLTQVSLEDSLLRIEDPGLEFTIDDGNAYFFAWDAGTFLRGDFDLADVNPEGLIRVDETNNSELLDAVGDRMNLALGFHLDADGDGELSDAEAAERIVKGAL